jgi:LmbE family N-acetylglucosaminyl deacetylase
MRAEDTFSRCESVIVVAHPDDESIAAGGMLGRMPLPSVVVVTDGAPREDGPDWRAYAATRRRELAAALAEARVPDASLYLLGVPDQEASFRMREISDRLLAILARLRPEVVLTHAYEGGHPDHDAVAFAVHAACARLAFPLRIWEFAGYHGRGGSMVIGEFIPGGEPRQTIVLTAEERDRKQRMYACHQSQCEMLRQFPLDAEHFRPAPAYDFSEAPHTGLLFYEQFDWGVEGNRWRTLATAAMAELGLEAPV